MVIRKTEIIMINHYTLSISLLTAAEFKKAFTEIPPSVTSLWVSDDWLFERTGAELSEAFSGCSLNVRSFLSQKNHNESNAVSKAGCVNRMVINGLSL